MPIFLPKMVDNFGLMEGLVVFSVFSKLFSNFAQIFYVLILRTYRKMVLMELWKNITNGPTDYCRHYAYAVRSTPYQAVTLQ